MAEGRSEALWAHTSHVLALVANVNRDPKKGSAFQASDFNPHARPANEPVVKVKLSEVKGLLLGMRPMPPRAR